MPFVLQYRQTTRYILKKRVNVLPKSTNQKAKLLHLARILEEQTDQEHPLSVRQLIGALAQQGIAAERKSIYDDVETLRQFGLDVVQLRGRSNLYYLGERRFQLPELKLLVDTVQAAKFITAKKSAELIKKLGGLASRYEAGQLQRQVHVQGRSKTMNERIYYNVDILQAAIWQNRRVSFRYYEWVVGSSGPRTFSQSWRRSGAVYVVSPWTMLWDSENYYLAAFDSEAGRIKHYRVDKMEALAVLPEARDGKDQFEALDIAEYTKRTFGMFGGEETDVALRFANRLVGVVVDRFGKDVFIQKDGEEHFTVTIQAAVSPQFIAWLLGFGNEVEVLRPQSVIQQLLQTLRDVQALYSG